MISMPAWKPGDPVPVRYRDAVSAQQIEFVYRTIAVQLVGNPLAGLLILWLLADRYPLPGLLTWFGLLVAVFLLRFLLWRTYWHEKRTGRARRRWGLHFTVSNVLGGLVWGSVAVLYFSPDRLAESTVLIVTIAGFTAASFSSHSAYLPAYFAFSTMAVGPLILRLLAEQGREFNLLAGLCAVFYAALVIYARTAQNQMKAAMVMKLQMEDLNQQLVEQKDLLEAAKDVAERANVAKSKFLASASHDLRQPLHALRLYVDYLAMRVSDDDLAGIVKRVSLTTGALEDLFSNLLELARVDAKVVQPTVGNVWVAPLVGRLFAEIEPEAVRKGLTLRTWGTDRVLRTDPALLDRILRNLIINAVKYTQTGGVLVSCRNRGESIAIEVWDTGVGIPAEQHHAIFEEFHQIGNPERDRTKGLGLGLAIAQRLAHLLGTAIQVSSRVGRGSRFRFELPLGDGKAVEDALSHAAGVPLGPVSIAGLRVALLDDDAAIREATARFFKDWGCAGIVGADPDSLKQQLRASGEAPRIIISDYRLPEGKTGIDFIKDLRREFGAEIPAIVITGDTSSERLTEVVANGASLLHKPVRAAQLRLLIEQLVLSRGVSASGGEKAHE